MAIYFAGIVKVEEGFPGRRYAGWPDEKQIVEGDHMAIHIGYPGNIKDVELIGIFIGGNKAPLVALIAPGESIVTPKESNFGYMTYFTTSARVDTCCEGRY